MLKRESFYCLIALISLCFVFNRCKKDEAASTPPKLGTPVMATVTPSSGVAGDVITIKGIAFSSTLSENVVKIGKGTAQVNEASSTQLTIVIPPEAVGLDSIVLTTPGGSSKYPFATHATFTDFTPSSGPIGTRIKITGTGLSIYDLVNFSENNLRAYTISSTPTELVVGVNVIGAGGTSGTLSILEFFGSAGNLQQTITTTKSFSLTSVPPVQVASFPGTARTYEPSGFAIGSQLFFGLGTDVNKNLSSDFWKYDSGSDTWTRVADFPGGGRASATSFSFNGKGYVLCGASMSSLNKDVWQYDPQLNTWKQLSNFPGAARSEAFSFVLGQYVYFGTGNIGNNSYSKDFWRYDPANDAWLQKADFAGGGFADCAGFAVGDLGYVTGGNGTTKTTTWSYSPSNDTWMALGMFYFNAEPHFYSGGSYGHSIGFTLNGIGYVGQDQYLYQLAPDVDSSHRIAWTQVQSPQAIQVPIPNSPGSSTLYTLPSGYCLATGTNAYIWYGTAEFWKFTPPN